MNTINQTAMRLLMAFGYIALTAIPTALLLRGLSMTDLSHGWWQAFAASWTGRDSTLWFMSWFALVLWSIPFLFKAVVFLTSALNSKFGSPWTFTLPGDLNEQFGAAATVILLAVYIPIVVAAPLFILVSNGASIASALPILVHGGSELPPGFAPLAWSFVAGTLVMRIFGLILVGGSGGSPAEEEQSIFPDVDNISPHPMQNPFQDVPVRWMS